MPSNGKLKKILRGIAITIIIYVTVSMLATKFIYDAIFDKYNAHMPQGILSETEEMFQNEQRFSFKSGKYNLEGMLYSDKTCENGLVILTPGLNSEVVEYEGVINSFLQEGFDVFAFNPTGHGNSGGDSSIGFLQIIYDLSSAVEFANSNFKYNDIYLFGHSRGGFASCCVMNSYDCITAVATVNSTDTAMDAIMAYSTDYVGNIAYGNYFFLDSYQDMIFGDDLSDISAVSEINKSTVPILIIQSENDEKIDATRYSLYSKREQIKSEKVDFVLYDKEGKSGHTSILYGEGREPNSDIIRIISDFYKNYDSKDLDE